MPAPWSIPVLLCQCTRDPRKQRLVVRNTAKAKRTLVTALTTPISYCTDYCRGKFSCLSWFFTLNCNFFPVNYGPVNWHYNSTKCYSKRFSVSSHFPLKTQKLFPAKVLPYMVFLKMWTYIMDPYSLIQYSG